MKSARTTRTSKTILGIVAAGITAAAITIPTISASADAPAPATPVVPRVAEPIPTAEEQELIDWALGLYSDAGLVLPPVEIGLYTTKDACEGNKGTYRPQPDGIAKVRVCDWHEREALRNAWRAKTLVHELAHAWADHNVDTDLEAIYSAHRGLDGWRNAADAWEDRGTEHAAETITWGILDIDMQPDVRMDRTDCDQMTEAYILLTGSEPTNGPIYNCD